MNYRNNKSSPYIIVEQPYVPLDLKILKENTEPSGVNKAIFKATLQTANENNQNNRYYRPSILQEIVSLLLPKARERRLYQEVDHPSIIPGAMDDSMALKRRAGTVELKNSASLIRNLVFDGKNVIGEIETLTGFRGPDIYNLIVNDRATIGFSLRMFGRIVTDPTTHINYVEDPITPVTYDIVSNPSHSSARILEFLPEECSQYIPFSDSSVIYEGSGYNIHEVDSRYTFDYIDALINESYSKYKFLNFNII